MADSKRKILHDQKAAADILDKSVAWMERARWAGNGPPYFKIGRAVRYEEDALYAWIAEHCYTSTAQYSEEHKPNTCIPACKQTAATFVQVVEDYALGADSMSYHVLQRKSSKDNYHWEPIAWYPTLEQCVNALADRAVRTCGAQSLSEALAEAQRITSEFCMALRAHFHGERRTESSGAPGKRARDVLSG